MHIPFTLYTIGGDPVEDPENITIQISRDGGAFETTEMTVHNLGLGCYAAHTDEDQLRCSQQALIHISADGCQSTILEYIPETPASEIADAVWNADKRTLTSLNTGSVKSSQYIVSHCPSSSSSSNSGGLRVSQVFGNR